MSNLDLHYVFNNVEAGQGFFGTEFECVDWILTYDSQDYQILPSEDDGIWTIQVKTFSTPFSDSGRYAFGNDEDEALEYFFQQLLNDAFYDGDFFFTDPITALYRDCDVLPRVALQLYNAAHQELIEEDDIDENIDIILDWLRDDNTVHSTEALIILADNCEKLNKDQKEQLKKSILAV